METPKRKRQFHVSRNSWGAQAERKVRRELNRLPLDRFIVAHDIKFKYGNIDHLVIRDDGAIFLIETKSHRGRVTYDGKRLLINGQPFKKNPICQIQRNIRWLRQWIQTITGSDVWIDAVLALPFTTTNSRKDQQAFPVIAGKTIIIGGTRLESILSA